MNERIKELALESGLAYKMNNGKYWIDAGEVDIHLEHFAELVRQEEREAISHEYFMSLDSDLENGVKWLNDKAHEDFKKNYPELNKFSNWLTARGEK